MDKVNILAYHGWGFDRTCWQPWRGLAEARGWNWLSSDRGYFNTPAEPALEETEETEETGLNVVVTHSYGLHCCPLERLRQAHWLVILGGFQDFHPLAERSRRRSQRVLAEMIHQFEQGPETVLQQFYRHCYDPDLPAAGSITKLNPALLYHDLKALAYSILDLTTFPSLERVLILHGTHDRIVPVQQGHELAIALQAKTAQLNYVEVQGTGHALPFTHPHHCWSFVFHE